MFYYMYATIFYLYFLKTILNHPGRGSILFLNF